METLDYGMPTLIENRNLEETAELCSELGLRFIELNMNQPQYQNRQLENISYFQNLAKQNHLYFTIHLDENLDVANFNPLVAEAYQKTVEKTIEIAKKLQIPVLNMHMNHGVHFTLPDRKVQLYEQYQEEYMASFVRLRKLCEEHIEGENIRISIENMDGFQSYEKAAIEYMLESEVFTLTWDVGHSQACGNRDEAFIRKHSDKLHHFHIHDVVGKKDHLALGTGEVDLEERLKTAAACNCRCVVETKTIESLRESVGWLKKKKYM